jgi:nicotinate-nucleotide pyrophosphorylase (carboxylating)
MTAPPQENDLPRLPHNLIDQAVKAALAEDLGLAGDITTDATVPRDASATAIIAARERGVVSGLPLAEAAFRAIGDKVTFEAVATDGALITKGDVLARISGCARSILTGERVALNFLGRMSGIATLTRAYVNQVVGTSARIVDTRKTTPGLRAFEKYAVRCGGGHNHRTGLFDAILIKDNHIAAAGSPMAAMQAARDHAGHMVKIEIEVDTLEQLREILPLAPDAVLLDNMSTDELREAVAIAEGRTLLEASGGVDLDSVRAIAETGVDIISVGALTHSAPVLDLGLDFQESSA